MAETVARELNRAHVTTTGIGSTEEVRSADETDVRCGCGITGIRNVEDFPQGYPRLAAFMSSDKDFTQFRRFSTLRTQLLLMLQHDIMLLERQLNYLDLRTENDNPLALRSIKHYDVDAARTRQESQHEQDHYHRPDNEANQRVDHTLSSTERLPACESCHIRPIERRREEDRCGFRRRLLSEIKRKLDEYDDVPMRARSVASFERPSDRDYLALRSYLESTFPLVERGMQWAKYKDDLLNFQTEAQPPTIIEGWLESIIFRFASPAFRRLFIAPEGRRKSSNDGVVYFSRTRIDNCVIPLATLVMFVVPVVAMYEVTLGGTRAGAYGAIGILAACILIFTLVITLLTTARKHEMFAAVAAYAAVLVVFLGNVSGTSSGSPNS
ncbi:MAG: hypothetical protein M1820_008336 [Bogoriella megaspora]|nr:MAG: hypothetical protein M1820_008336 [Bogoriella megaspora]